MLSRQDRETVEAILKCSTFSGDPAGTKEQLNITLPIDTRDEVFQALQSYFQDTLLIRLEKEKFPEVAEIENPTVADITKRAEGQRTTEGKAIYMLCFSKDMFDQCAELGIPDCSAQIFLELSDADRIKQHIATLQQGPANVGGGTSTKAQQR